MYRVGLSLAVDRGWAGTMCSRWPARVVSRGFEDVRAGKIQSLARTPGSSCNAGVTSTAKSMEKSLLTAKSVKAALMNV